MIFKNAERKIKAPVQRTKRYAVIFCISAYGDNDLQNKQGVRKGKRDGQNPKGNAGRVISIF